MKATCIYEKGSHKWIIFGRDPSRKKQIIDTNQHLMMAGGEAILLDPGGIELFAPMLAAVGHPVAVIGTAMGALVVFIKVCVPTVTGAPG